MSDAHKPSGSPKLLRVAFTTSRLAEFCGMKELTAQTGHAPGDWPVVIGKELIDNGLDECEEAAIAPEISIAVSARSPAQSPFYWRNVSSKQNPSFQKTSG